MGGVIDGQAVSAAVTNPAFLDANGDDVAQGIIGFVNTAPASGPSIGNTQGLQNHLKNTTGATETTDGTTYPSNNRLVNGQNHVVALGELDSAFDPTTGHKHTGAAGDAPPIAGTGIANVPFVGVFQLATALAGITGTSTVVTGAMAGFTASSGPTVEGVVVTAPNNKVPLYQNSAINNGEDFNDSLGSVIYGRLTFSAGVWKLSFFSLVSGVETPYNFTVAASISWYFQQIWKRIVDAPVYSDQLTQPMNRRVRSLAKSAGDTTQLFADVTLEEGSNVTITRTGNKFTVSAIAGSGQDETVTLVNFAASPYAMLITDHTVFVDCSGGNVVINLYQMLGNIGKRLRFKKTDATANTLTINAFAGDNIDGATPLVITNQYQAFTLVSRGTNLWGIFA